jgi:hypothetical protein
MFVESQQQFNGVLDIKKIYILLLGLQGLRVTFKLHFELENLSYEQEMHFYGSKNVDAN